MTAYKVLLIACVLIASSDGFIAIYSALRRTDWKKQKEEENCK